MASRKICIDRKGYRRAGFTRTDGTRVRPTTVARSRFCIPDPGTPGRRARGSERGPFAHEPPWIQREGDLGGPGYTKRPTEVRRKFLRQKVKEDGYRAAIGKLQAILRNTQLHPGTRRTLQSDSDWLVATFGGPGSFGSRPRKEKRVMANRQGSAADVRDEIVDSMARTFHVTAFMDLQDQRREDGLKYVDPGPGGEWMDVAPSTTRAAKEFAEKFAVAMEKANNASLNTLYQRAMDVPGKRYRPRDTPDNFGHGFAMQSLGHGVSWFDDNPEFPINLPDTNFSYDQGRGGKLLVGYSSISSPRARNTRR